MTGQVIDSRAVIFDIQNFSLHDGPGIRTTVFFKGCPLRCPWCHNPESRRKRPELMFYRKLCTGCLLCVRACERGAQVALSGGIRSVNRRVCTGCGKCTKVCCYDALVMCGKIYSPAELGEKIRGDIHYFNLDGKEKEKGGITFSGGEPLQNTGFIKVFHDLFPDIHIAVETSGWGTREALETILDGTDLFLFDIKLIDPNAHKKWCGVDNKTIFANLDFLYAKKKRIILRLPLVPGINDTGEQFDGIAALLEKYPAIERAEILPYHTFGAGKAEAAGHEYRPGLPRAGADRDTIDAWLREFEIRACRNIYLL
jgi:pyruvate formate lyase activating enzyme